MQWQASSRHSQRGSSQCGSILQLYPCRWVDEELPLQRRLFVTLDVSADAADAADRMQTAPSQSTQGCGAPIFS